MPTQLRVPQGFDLGITNHGNPLSSRLQFGRSNGWEADVIDIYKTNYSRRENMKTKIKLVTGMNNFNATRREA